MPTLPDGDHPDPCPRCLRHHRAGRPCRPRLHRLGSFADDMAVAGTKVRRGVRAWLPGRPRAPIALGVALAWARARGLL